MPAVPIKRKRAPGAGRPKGSGAKYGESTKVVRLPESLANDVLGFVQKYQDLEQKIHHWNEEIKARAAKSKDGFKAARIELAYDCVTELLNILED